MITDPLIDPAPEEVPLAAAPLVRVIVQVRFPVIASVERREFIAPFQEAVRKQYPVLRVEEARSMVLGVPGVQETRSTIWRFFDLTQRWRVSLAADFLAVETEQYSSRDDLVQRMEHLLTALRDTLDPQVIDRLGVRYIDRVTEPNLNDLTELVRGELLGVLATPLSSHVQHAVGEHLFVLPKERAHMLARWGRIPAGATVDPNAVPPIGGASWLLDLDAFRAGSQRLDVAATAAETRALATRVYTFFRWAVRDEFLARYGRQA